MNFSNSALSTASKVPSSSILGNKKKKRGAGGRNASVRLVTWKCGNSPEWHYWSEEGGGFFLIVILNLKYLRAKQKKEECPPRSAGTPNRAVNPDLIQPVNICLSGGLMNVTADVNLGMK